MLSLQTSAVNSASLTQRPSEMASESAASGHLCRGYRRPRDHKKVHMLHVLFVFSTHWLKPSTAVTDFAEENKHRHCVFSTYWQRPSTSGSAV